MRFNAGFFLAEALKNLRLNMLMSITAVTTTFICILVFGLGLLVSEFRGDFAPEYMGKIAGQATHIERLRADGDRAIWIEGAPHLFFYRPPDSDFAESELRLAHNVLLVERGNLLIRLEGSFNRERALELAHSLGPAG